MASYVVPQVEIHQLFSEIPVSLSTTQVPFLFGPNYQLHRFSDATEKVGTYLGFYTSEDQEGSNKFFGAYPGALDEDQVDTTYTKLFGDNVLVKLGDFSNVARVYNDSGTESSSDDYIEKELLDITVDPDSSSDPTPEAKEIIAGRSLRLHIGSGQSATTKDVEILEVDYENSTATKIRVSIDEELDDSDVISTADLCEYQSGVEFSREDPTDTEAKVRLFWEEYEDLDPESETYLHKGIQIQHALYAKLVDKDYLAAGVYYGKVLSADLYLTYRELLTAASDTLHSLVNASDVANALGTVHPDNPLAQAVYNAALNAGGQTIRYMAVPTDDKEGYNTVLNAATLTKEVYFLVPVTRDGDVLDLVQSHVNSMSAATSKRWRIAFVSAEIPEEDPIYNADANTDGDDFYAMVKSVDTIHKTADVQFVTGTTEGGQTIWTPSQDTACKKDLKVGDILYINYDNKEWGKVVPTICKVTKIVTNNTIRVDNSEAGLVVTTVGEKVEVKHPYTNAEKATVIKNLSSSFADRRMYNVFPSVFSTSGVQQTGEFAAACVAGLVSSCLPQQPITNLELVGIDDIPLVYQTFSMDQLNTMASGGTFIVMQDLPNDQVYVRHQISTDYESNNLNTAELSITKNVDSISYFFDDLLSPYIGKYNITPELLTTLRVIIGQGITSLSSNSYGLYGSQLIADGTEILLLEQDALLKDHVNCNLQLNVPYPFNHLVLKLFV